MNYRKSINMAIAAGDATSSAYELSGWRRCSLELPAQSDFSTSSATIGFLGCSSATGTFYPLVTDATSNFVASSITMMESESWPRYLKVGADRTAIAAYTPKLHVTD